MLRSIALAASLALFWVAGLSISFSSILATTLFLFSLLGSHKAYLLFKTGDRDLRALFRYLYLRFKIHQAQKSNSNVAKLFQKNVRKHPNKIAFYFEEEQWTFQQLEDYSNKVANYFKDQGIKKGDSVAIMMMNCVEFIGLWLGLSKLGAVPALINYNLRKKQLTHCLAIVDCKSIICAPEFQDAVGDVLSEFPDMKTYVGIMKSLKDLSLTDAINLEAAIESFPTSCPPEIDEVNFSDKLLYIYTSGTTGLPKAAVITHSRAVYASYGMYIMVGIKSDDIVYDPLPLYHTVGGLVGPGMCLYLGASIALRKKFSASAYVVDCAKYKCTVGQYIGEICRYLLNTPPKPEDTQHQVRVMFGNGLRPQVWGPFQERFQIQKISEFYGATEGNANIINMDGKPGAIGFLSVILPKVYPCCLIKIDEETGDPIRDENGLCVHCKPGEAGEFVGKIIRNDPTRDYHGYADKKATEKKIVHDVWSKGDLAFLSGDILIMDDEGYLYFKDRRGDTFRWKGENVSTTEVEGVLSKIVSLTDVVVYGVEIPGSEGRAGMVAILDPDEKVDLDALAKGYQDVLPSYAQPIFVRLVSKLDMTGTYKLKKVELQKEGYDVNTVQDKIFFLDSKNKKYIPLTTELYTKISNEEMRL